MGTAALQEGKFRLDRPSVLETVSRVFERVAAHRQAQANSFVRPYLARLTEDELRANGFSDAEIANIKASDESQIRYQL